MRVHLFLPNVILADAVLLQLQSLETMLLMTDSIRWRSPDINALNISR